jgi:hypothetical protein
MLYVPRFLTLLLLSVMVTQRRRANDHLDAAGVEGIEAFNAQCHAWQLILE